MRADGVVAPPSYSRFQQLDCLNIFTLHPVHQPLRAPLSSMLRRSHYFLQTCASVMHVQRCVATAVRYVAGGQGHADVAVTCLVPHDDGHLAPSAPKPAARAGASGLLTQSLRLVAAAAQGASLTQQLRMRAVLVPCSVSYKCNTFLSAVLG